MINFRDVSDKETAVPPIDELTEAQTSNWPGALQHVDGKQPVFAIVVGLILY